MKIEPFGVEQWMAEHETQCVFNLAETCVESLTVGELFALTQQPESALNEILKFKMTYGAIEGSQRLRQAICQLYSKQSIKNILVTHGTIGANALVHKTLISPGDQVVAVLPTYQQHYSIPQSFGAEVKILRLREKNGFLPDLNELESLTTKNTRLIVLNNPNNPTGALLNQAMLQRVVAIARRCDAWLLCDEVYRGIDHDGDGFTASIADLYEKGISTASMSKAFSLAGLRLGWIAAAPELIHQVSLHRDYDTISVGMVNDYLASIALENHPALLVRSREITRRNLQILDEWIGQETHISYVKPRGGTTALLKYSLEIPSRDLCLALLQDTGVMFTPGSALDTEGYLRIGYAGNTAALSAGLSRVSEFLHAERILRYL